MKSKYEQDINKIIDIIERELKRYEHPTRNDVCMLISDRVKYSKKDIISKEDIKATIKESAQQKELMKQLKENYYDTSWADVLAMLFMYANKTDESQKQLLRANYNLQSNNEIFRILNLIYNKDLNDTDLIDENNYILKMNISFFIIEYVFESIKKDLNNIALSKDDYITLVDNLINKYNGDIQSIGDVLLSNKPKEQNLQNRYNEIKEYLKQKGFIETHTSKFKRMRNAASHGEFYPDFDDVSNINIGIEEHGILKEKISYLELIDFVENKLSIIDNNEEIEMLMKLLRSNNITNTILDIIDKGESEKLVSNLCILSLFNTIQYNNENYFRIDKRDKKKASYADSIDLKQFFSTSYPIDERTNFDIMQTIKNALGHMNVSFVNGVFTFDNKMNNEQCTCSMEKLLVFLTKDELYNLTISTSYYEQCMKFKKYIKEKFNSNKIIKLKDYLPKEMQKSLTEELSSNSIDVSKCSFIINEDKKQGSK
jgi:hypothetical protein